VADFVNRAARQPGAKNTTEESSRRTRSWARNRLDIWEALVRSARDDRATQRTYSPFDVSKSGTPLLHTALNPPEDPEPGEEKFCAPTSMRDVEPSVHLWLAQPGLSKKGRS